MPQHPRTQASSHLVTEAIIYPFSDRTLCQEGGDFSLKIQMGLWGSLYNPLVQESMARLLEGYGLGQEHNVVRTTAFYYCFSSIVR